MLWESPLLSVEGRRIVLNVGLPAAATREEVLRRFGPFGFGGLAAVRLHVESSASAAIRDELQRQYGQVPVELVVESPR